MELKYTSQMDLASVLELLSLPASDQVAWLKEIGTHPDASELAYMFEDALAAFFCALPDAEASDGKVQTLRVINQMLDEMSGPANAALWMADALASHPMWEKVREHARQCLNDVPQQ